jgi:hypothetical protein
METKQEYPELYKEFNVTIVTDVNSREPIRIMKKSGIVFVSPIFEFLDIKIQKFLMHSIMYLFDKSKEKIKDSFYQFELLNNSDKHAIGKMKDEYPDIEKEYWIKAIACFNKKSHPAFFNSSHVDHLYYVSRDLHNDIDDRDGDMFANARQPMVQKAGQFTNAEFDSPDKDSSLIG